MQKKVARMLEKIRNARGLSEHEKLLFARSLAATPDQRWQLHEDFLRSHDLFTRSSRKKHGFSSLLGLQRIYRSEKHVGRPKVIAHLPLLKQTMALESRQGR